MGNSCNVRTPRYRSCQGSLYPFGLERRMLNCFHMWVTPLPSGLSCCGLDSVTSPGVGASVVSTLDSAFRRSLTTSNIEENEREFGCFWHLHRHKLNICCIFYPFLVTECLLPTHPCLASDQCIQNRMNCRKHRHYRYSMCFY